MVHVCHARVAEKGRGIVSFGRVYERTRQVCDAPSFSISFLRRTFCLMTTKCQAKVTLPALTRLLPALPNLNTIHVLHCNKPSDIAAATKNLYLPSVRTLILPTLCYPILRACPNATHVRCSAGDGALIISYLRFCNVQVLDGMIDWTHKNIMERT